jgi:hypothetical protein
MLPLVSKPKRPTPEAGSRDSDKGAPGECPVLKKLTKETRKKATETSPLRPEQEQIWEQAAGFCVRRLPTLWTAGQPRREPGRQGRWIVPIVLRYPDGYEGTLGEIAFDEQRREFTLLTERAVLSERAREVAASHPDS